MEVEKATLWEQIAVALASLVAEARCMPDDWEDMREEMMMWLRCWEEKTVDTADTPVLAEANDLYEWWTTEEVELHAKAEQDIQMGEETMVELGDDSAVKMSHVEVPQPAHKAIAESDKEEHCKGAPCIRPSGKTCDGCTKMKQGCEKSSKGVGKRAQAGASVVQSTKVAKASPSKWTNDDDDDIMEVVKSRAHGKGKAPVHGGLDGKTAMALS
ncbi:hypothetical protein M404DRAFT_25647 [Pisolithus tinctorius Marx 270]|uniref:Uncharacterized protein n=1 Tax=Pisolithus tinctorius Marx 270 TaxID=870435 RepID=A0A0C3J7K4_PISTI|nr:hypothetical protein M404DRAFT_25647 [Pisolithus tinctorius Marx 270]